MESKDEQEHEIEFIKKAPPVKNFFSTGCTLLDLAIANTLPGGFPAGRVTQIYGGESSAKSVLLAEAFGSAQRQKGRAKLIDREGTWDEARAFELHGVNCDNPELWDKPDQVCETIEELFDVHIAAETKKSDTTKGPCCMGVDSLTGLPSKTELSEEMGTATFGTSRAKALSLGFRKHLGDMVDTELGLIIIDQTRDNVGVTFGDKDAISGGKAVKFYSSVRLKLSHIDRIKNSAEKIVGIKVGFFTRKNKIGPPFREGTFRLLFDYGIDDIGSSLEWLHENDPDLWEDCKKVWPSEYKDKKEDPKKEAKSRVRKSATKETKKQAPYAVPALKVKARGLNQLCEKIEDENLEAALIKEVERVWRIVYAPLERKKRVRIGDN